MSTKLEEAKQKLQFVSRALAHGYIDFDSLDELGVAINIAIRLITEHEQGEQQPLPLDLEVTAYRVTVYEPATSS